MFAVVHNSQSAATNLHNRCRLQASITFRHYPKIKEPRSRAPEQLADRMNRKKNQHSNQGLTPSVPAPVKNNGLGYQLDCLHILLFKKLLINLQSLLPCPSPITCITNLLCSFPLMPSSLAQHTLPLPYIHISIFPAMALSLTPIFSQ